MIADFETWEEVSQKTDATNTRLDALAAVVQQILNGTVTPAPQPATSAQFLKLDLGAQGTWKTVYGLDGYMLAGDGISIPAYMSFAVSGAKQDWTWAISTADVRGLQKSGSPSDRIAACHTNPQSLTYDINITGGNAKRVALYCLDWEKTRTQTIQIIDAVTRTVLDTQTVSNFNGGMWLAWNIKGHVNIVITNAKSNAIASGLFFG